MIKNYLIILLFIFTALTQIDQALADALPPESFAKNVHLSYLNGNFRQMTLFIKQALEAHPHNETLKKNLLGVLENAYALPNSKDITPDWHLPPGIKNLDVGLYRHTYENDLFWGYDVSVSLHVAENSIQDLTLKNAVGDIILQKSTKVGEWKENSYSHGEWSAKIKTHIGKNPLASGLYFIDVVFVNKTHHPFQAWFLMPEVIFENFPKVIAPQKDEQTQTTTPLFQWEKFDNPLQSSYTRKSVSVHITSQQCESAGSIFYLSTSSPLQQFELGSLPNQFQVHNYKAIQLSHKEYETIYDKPNTLFVYGLKALKNGKHMFSIDYSVDRQFGEMGFGLATENTVGFRVDNGVSSNTYSCDSIPNEYAKP